MAANRYTTGPGYVQDPRTGNWILSQNATTETDELGRVVGGFAPGYGQFGANAALGSPMATGSMSGSAGGSLGGAGGAAYSPYALPGQAGGAGASPAAAAQPPEVAANRKAMFDVLQPGQGYFNSPLGQQAQGAIGNALSGVDVPYTQGVQDRMFGQQADLNAGTRASQDDLIRRQLAERGMEGSGAGLAAMLGAGRDQSAANSSALTGIQNQAQTENYAARERARNQAESFLATRSSAEAPYRLKEADIRAQSEYTQQDPLGNALAGLVGMVGQRALGSPQQGASLGLGSGGAFNVGGSPGRATVGPGSGSNTGISVGNTPTRALGVGGLGANQGGSVARQATQGYQPTSGYTPATPASRAGAYAAGSFPTPQSFLGQSGYDPYSVYGAKGW